MKPLKIIPQKSFGIKFNSKQKSITQKQSIIYSLGIGFNQDPLKQKDYKYTSQFQSNFTVFPTIASTFTLNITKQLLDHPDFPIFNPHMRLHAEEKLQFIKPINTNTIYKTKGSIVDVADKGKFAILTSRSQTFSIINGKEQLSFIKQSSSIIKGMQPFGFKGKNMMTPIPSIPKRNPDIIFQQKTFLSQAFLYRLNGDENPLHIDPKISKLQNFVRPILHGLGTYGVVAKGLVQNLFDNDPNRLKIYHVRFTGHVFPGQTLIIRVWRNGSQLIIEAIVKQRNKGCIVGYITERQQAKL